MYFFVLSLLPYPAAAFAAIPFSGLGQASPIDALLCMTECVCVCVPVPV